MNRKIQKKNQVTTTKDKVKIVVIGALILIGITIIGLAVGSYGASVEQGILAGM